MKEKRKGARQPINSIIVDKTSSETRKVTDDDFES